MAIIFPFFFFLSVFLSFLFIFFFFVPDNACLHCLGIHLSSLTTVCLSWCLSVCLGVCLSVFVFVCLLWCASICLLFHHVFLSGSPGLSRNVFSNPLKIHISPWWNLYTIHTLYVHSTYMTLYIHCTYIVHNK